MIHFKKSFIPKNFFKNSSLFLTLFNLWSADEPIKKDFMVMVVKFMISIHSKMSFSVEKKVMTNLYGNFFLFKFFILIRKMKMKMPSSQKKEKKNLLIFHFFFHFIHDIK